MVSTLLSEAREQLFQITYLSIMHGSPREARQGSKTAVVPAPTPTCTPFLCSTCVCLPLSPLLLLLLLLSQAHMSRLAPPISDYVTDTRSALDNSVRLAQVRLSCRTHRPFCWRPHLTGSGLLPAHTCVAQP